MFVKKCALFLGIFVVLIALLAPATNPARAATAAQANGAKPNMGKAQQASSAQVIPTDQIIIKYKTNSVAKASPNETAQMQRLNAAAGTTLTYVRAMSGDANVLRLPDRLPLDQVEVVTKKLMALPEVDYAEPDRISVPFFSPNDPQYANQWDLFGTYGINAPAAWDITTGSSSIVVAVIDTGITNHVDLSGRTVPGYDFISDSQVANDGNGRDSDPSDPGDWITAAENASGFFAGCPVENSSWHGTHTAGTIGAAGNNSIGVAGINWVSKILPVRVLGKCGGYTSDIVDGMRWSAGLSVSGVPANANPARVLSISLGGSGACDSTSQSAINEITAAGAVVVVAAGNSNADASGFNPGNCNGVITVAATDINGDRAYYSNYGSSIEISAPGGAQSYANDPNGILSTLNTGTTSPVADTYIYYQGTSMATPHVSGVVSLMLSVKPSLTPAQVLQALQSSARAFPSGSTCTTSNCGAGMLDAAAAVALVNNTHTISGYVRTGASVGISGVTMSGLPHNPNTDASGFYSDQVANGWSGTVTPTKAAYTFNPINLGYTNVTSDVPNQNYTGTHQSSGNTILLVDDDDNTPDVRSYYTDALTALGKTYDVWDTNNSDTEPAAADLAAYQKVIWFTGHEFGGYAGPGTAGSSALSTWLDGGGCFLISSQDYFYDKGLTSFMSTYLGVSGGTSDVSQTVVTGANVFAGLGPYTLSYTFANFSDTVLAGATAESAFSGDMGNAGVERNSGVYRTAYFGFPVEAIASATDRQQVLGTFLNSCSTQPAPGSFNKAGPANGAPAQSTNPTLSWGSSSNATSYEYCIDTSNDNTCDGTGTWTNTSLNTTVGLFGLNPTTTYYWQVRAKNGTGTTEANSGTWWSFTTGASVPIHRIYLPLVLKPIPVPAAFNKTGPSNGATGQPANPTLSWGTSSTATSYDYCYDTTNNNVCDGSWTTTGASTSVPLSGLTLSTNYYWQVRANNAGGSTYADGGTWWSFRTADPLPAPGSFNKSTPTNGVTGQSVNPTLSWGASSNAASYDYCYATTTGCTSWASAGTNTSVALSGLLHNQIYYWQVRAVNASGNTLADSGTYWSFTTVVAPSGPTAGFWQMSGGALQFYVTPSQTAVKNFAVHINVTGCGTYWVTHTIDASISSNQFSFSGSFYASGTFDSTTSAHGTFGFSSFPISGCGTISGSSSWTASWINSSQPAFVVPSIIQEPALQKPDYYFNISKDQ